MLSRVQGCSLTPLMEILTTLFGTEYPLVSISTARQPPPAPPSTARSHSGPRPLPPSAAAAAAHPPPRPPLPPGSTTGPQQQQQLQPPTRGGTPAAHERNDSFGSDGARQPPPPPRPPPPPAQQFGSPNGYVCFFSRLSEVFWTADTRIASFPPSSGLPGTAPASSTSPAASPVVVGRSTSATAASACFPSSSYPASVFDSWPSHSYSSIATPAPRYDGAIQPPSTASPTPSSSRPKSPHLSSYSRWSTSPAICRAARSSRILASSAQRSAAAASLRPTPSSSPSAASSSPTT